MSCARARSWQRRDRGSSSWRLNRPFAETLGNQISAQSTYQLHSHNSDVDEKLLNRIRSQVAGFVKLASMDENISTEVGREMLHLRGKATVCAPKTPLLVKDVVRVASAINMKGRRPSSSVSTLLDVFSKSLDFLISGDPNDTVDTEITGRITRH